ncbi:hypothetical protein NW768_006827 [Fusarium equiseti]|uniref:Uncharacterized protein n=1 Tax=Fusarium equiseti TaxID=61235 RepID=A0ABQ8R9A2_FUSEQ|nr:hypothetical protein NW768_006827 [Fusarium equiseti]
MGKPGAGNEKMYDVADQCYLNANVLLRNFIERIGNQDPTKVPLGVFEDYDPKSDRSKKDGHAKFEEDEQILGALFTGVITLIHGVKAFPVEDELLRGVREMENTGKMPLYLVFASQIILDIHSFLREDTDLAFRHMCERVDAMHVDLVRQKEFSVRVKSPSWSAVDEGVLWGYGSTMAWIKEDPVFLAKKRRAEKSGVVVPESQKYRLLKLSPIISGLLLFQFRAQVYNLSITIMNCWGSVTYAAHLYNALVSEEELGKDSWPDMEVVQSYLGKSNLFIGDPPTDKEGYARRLFLQMGYSASAIPSDGLLKSYATSRSGPRKIKRRAPVSYMFIDRYLQRSTRINLSPEDVDEIVSRNQNQHREYERGTTKINYTPDVINEFEDKDNPASFHVYSIGGSGKERATKRKKATGDHQLKPKDLLMSLSTALTGEIMEFAMPYLDMHLLTWDILNGIKEACYPILMPLHDRSYLQHEHQIPQVVIYIFAELCRDPEGVGKKLMRAAAQAFNKIVAEKGGVDTMRKKFSEREGMTIYSTKELFGESHERYHERNGGGPAEDCDWDCDWHADWENDDDKEEEGDKEEENDKES